MAYGPRMNRKEASRYLAEKWGLSYKPSTLAKLAWNGEGPLYNRAGRRVQYLPADLDAWARQKITGKYRSTSEYPRPPEVSTTAEAARTVGAGGDGLGQHGKEGDGRHRSAPGKGQGR